MPKALNEKLSAFIAGTLEVERFIDDKNTHLAELRQSPASMKYTFFEEGASLNSPTIAKVPSVFVGAHSYMNPGGYTRTNVFIGRFCSIGRRVTIGAGGHHMAGLSTSPILSAGTPERNYTETERAQLGLRSKPQGRLFTILQSDVWVGDGVVIMPNVTVGVGAVIGANSVVTRDVAPYTIVAGMPAVPIRRRFPDEVCAALLASDWWDLSVPVLKKLGTGNVLSFIDAVAALDPAEVREPVYTTFGVRTG